MRPSLEHAALSENLESESTGSIHDTCYGSGNDHGLWANQGLLMSRTTVDVVKCEDGAQNDLNLAEKWHRSAVGKNNLCAGNRLKECIFELGG